MNGGKGGLRDHDLHGTTAGSSHLSYLSENELAGLDRTRTCDLFRNTEVLYHGDPFSCDTCCLLSG